MPTTVTSLEDRTNTIEDRIESVKNQVSVLSVELSSFRSRIDTIVALARWFGVFAAGLTVTILIGVIAFAHSVGRLESNIERLRDAELQQEKLYQKQLDGFKEVLQQQEKIYQKQDDMIRRLELKMTEISVKLSNIEEKLKQKP